jgi:hypothetical protein
MDLLPAGQIVESVSCLSQLLSTLITCRWTSQLHISDGRNYIIIATVDDLLSGLVVRVPDC